MQNNVSVSMWEVPVRGNLPGDTQQATALNWNVTAPCSLEGGSVALQTGLCRGRV